MSLKGILNHHFELVDWTWRLEVEQREHIFQDVAFWYERVATMESVKLYHDMGIAKRTDGLQTNGCTHTHQGKFMNTILPW